VRKGAGDLAGALQAAMRDCAADGTLAGAFAERGVRWIL
jgi:hypothetical protein